MKKTSYITSFMLMIVLCVFMTGCKSGEEQAISRSAIYFDTPISITLYYTKGNMPDEDIFDDIFKQCEYYESICDRHDSSSELARLNERKLDYTVSRGIKMYEVSEHLYRMIEAGYDAHNLYTGEFDITITPVAQLWNFGALGDKFLMPPASSDITKALTFVDSNSIILDSNKKEGVYRIGFADNNPSIEIDLGSLAKGYIADRLKEFIIKNNIDNSIINLGGNIYATGSHMDGSPFVIGIKEPFSNNEHITSVEITDASVVTSGIYERYYEYEESLYHHILSASTGYPCSNDLLSVTIIGDNSLQCDILSTSCLLLGKDEAKKLIKSIDGVSAVLITNDYETITIE